MNLSRHQYRGALAGIAMFCIIVGIWHGPETGAGAVFGFLVGWWGSSRGWPFLITIGFGALVFSSREKSNIGLRRNIEERLD